MHYTQSMQTGFGHFGKLSSDAKDMTIHVVNVGRVIAMRGKAEIGAQGTLNMQISLFLTSNVRLMDSSLLSGAARPRVSGMGINYSSQIPMCLFRAGLSTASCVSLLRELIQLKPAHDDNGRG